MTPQQRYRLNDGALRARINEGDDFIYIGRDPFRQNREFDLVGSELLRLQERGIAYEYIGPSDVQRFLAGN